MITTIDYRPSFIRSLASFSNRSVRFIALITLSMLVTGQATLAIDPAKRSRVDWTTMASTYTHDAQGVRVDQFSTGIEPTVVERPDYQRSGYRHYRSTLQAGNSADNFHIVDQWGPQVRPYGEWRYPYRPFSSPYPAWGPQPPVIGGSPWLGGVGLGGVGIGGVGIGLGRPGFGGIGVPFGFPGQGFGTGNFTGAIPNNPQFNPGGPGFGVGPNNALRPDQDDYYAPAPDTIPPTTDRDFFYIPSP